METFESATRDIMRNEDRQDEYSCHQRKFEEYEERLAYIHHQVRKTTDIFGNTSRHRQNQGFAGEMMGRTMTANNHFSEIIEEVKQTVRTERNRLEDERESLYRKRSELI